MTWNKDNLESLLEQVKSLNYLGKDVYSSPAIFKVKELYKNLLNGNVDDELIYQAIHILGEADFQQAADFVAKFLNSGDPELRSIAIHTVGLHWRLKEFSEGLKNLVNDDEDEYIRGEAAVGLGHIYKASKDIGILDFLCHKLKDNTEEFDSKEQYYSAILCIWGETSRNIYSITRNLKSENDFNGQLIKEIESFCQK